MDEKLQKERQNLEIFKQQLVFSEQTTTEQAYQARLEQLRAADLQNMNFTGVSDYATAMALTQINLEKRISAITEEIRQQAPAVQVTAPPDAEPAAPVQSRGFWASFKSFFSNLFSRSRSEDPPTEPISPVQVVEQTVAEPVNIDAVQQSITETEIPAQVNNALVLRSSNTEMTPGTDDNGQPMTEKAYTAKLKSEWNGLRSDIQNMETNIKTGQPFTFNQRNFTPAEGEIELARLKAAYAEAEAAYENYCGIVTPERMRKMRASVNGARGDDGNFLMQWYKPLATAVQGEIGTLLQSMKERQVDFKGVMQNTEGNTQFTRNPLKLNKAITALAGKALLQWKEHLQSDAGKQYVKMIYQALGPGFFMSYRDRFKGEAAPPITPDVFHQRVRETMPTKGLDPLSALSTNKEVVSDPFQIQMVLMSSKLIGVMSLIRTAQKNGDPIDDVFEPFLAPLQEICDLIEEIGADVCAELVEEGNQWLRDNPAPVAPPPAP